MTEKPLRSPNGKWLPGQSGNPNGRAPSVYEDALVTLRKVCAEVIAGKLTVEVWGRIVDKQIEKAEQGSENALTWLNKWAAPPANLVSTPMPGYGIPIEPIDDYRGALAALAPRDENDDGSES